MLGPEGELTNVGGRVQRRPLLAVDGRDLIGPRLQLLRELDRAPSEDALHQRRLQGSSWLKVEEIHKGSYMEDT